MASIPLEDLPLSRTLRAKLEDWARIYDSLADSDYAWPDAGTRLSWQRLGHRLLDDLRLELGEDYEVVGNFD